MKDYAKKFYKSPAWQRTRAAYMESKHYLCERCGRPAVICHHKHYLTPANIQDPSVALNWENLECLCQDCHNKEHMGRQSRAVFDDMGNVVNVIPTGEAMQQKRELAAYEKNKCMSADKANVKHMAR